MEPILTKFISSAAAISALAILTRFFGNIISDQKPYCDDRKWDAELSGAFFLGSIIVPSAIGAAIGAYWGFQPNTIAHFTYFVIVGFVQIPFIFSNQILYKKLYSDAIVPKAEETKDEKPAWAADFQKTIEEVQAACIWFTKYVPFWLLDIPLGYVLIREYLGGNVVWFTVIVAGVFYALVSQAVFYSLTKYNKFPKADVYLVDEDEPIRNLELLRYNADNVKFRENDEAVIISKGRIVKIILKKENSAVKIESSHENK